MCHCYSFYSIVIHAGVNITYAQADFTMDEGNAGMSSSVNVCLSITPPSGGLDRNVVVTLNTEEDTADSDEPDFEPFNVQLTFTDSLTVSSCDNCSIQ